MKLSKEKRSVIDEAARRGYDVTETDTKITVFRRRKGSGKIIRGIVVFQDGSSLDATVCLSVAKSMRSAADWRAILGLKG